MEHFKWINDLTRTFMSRGYLVEGQSVEDRVREITDTFEQNLVKMGMESTLANSYASKFYENMAMGYYSLATPVWTNYGSPRGYPVSCFGSVAGDSMPSIAYTSAETKMLMAKGGGTSGSYDLLRPRGAAIQEGRNGESSGAVHFMKDAESLTEVVSQGSARRGFFTPYLNADHPDIMEFLTIGDEGSAISTLTTGVVISDDFIERAKVKGSYEQKVLIRIHKARSEKGHPYIVFQDNANNGRPDVYKSNNMPILASNMCAEIMLPSSTEETFVCVLSSINLAEYESWKGTDAVQVLTLFLDTVAEEFITKLEADKLTTPSQQWFLERVLQFTKRHRALGLGTLGWATALQRRMLSFESREAARLNLEIFKHIDKETKDMSHNMAEWFGEPELLVGTGRRNTTLTAVAPTKSSSFILGQVSQGIEPEFSNAYLKKVAKATTLVRNPVLVDLLESKGLNTKEVWDDIEKHAGSVQHVDYLTKEEKDVFKTIHEIPVEALLYQAAARQPYIEQGQSLSFPLPPTTTAKEHNRVMLLARDLGIKSLYYLYNMNAAQMAARELAGTTNECVACGG